MKYPPIPLILSIALCQISCKQPPSEPEKEKSQKETSSLSRQFKARNLNKADLHLKQIHLAILEFENEEGIRPGQMIVEEGNLAEAQAVTANQCFRQLLQGLPSVRDEDIFYTPSVLSKAPDRDIGDQGNHFKQACQKGEVAFLYVDNPKSKSGAPLAAAPLLDTSGRFDANIYGGKAAVLYTDGTVRRHDINPETGKIEIKVKGKTIDLFSADNPHFRTPPNIKYPEPK